MGVELFDAHCDTLSRCARTGEGLRENTGHLDLRRTAAFRPYAQVFALFADRDEEEPEAALLAQLALFRREMERNRDVIAPCRTGGEVRAAGLAGKAAALLSAEGGELLGCDPERLPWAREQGVAAVNLTWNHANALSGSHCDRPELGLSPLGVRFVRRLEELGMLPDVSHLSDPGFWDVMEHTAGPVLASHSNARAVFFHTRNLTDGQITAIIDRNGVIGLNLFRDFLGEGTGPDPVIAHLEHMLALGGERSVAIGGDWDGMDRLPPGIRDIRGLEELRERLLRRNYPEALVRDLFYFNMMRIVSERCSTSAQETGTESIPPPRPSSAVWPPTGGC